MYGAGFGMLLNSNGYKPKREEGKFIQVDRFFPGTKLYSCCGYKNDLLSFGLVGNRKASLCKAKISRYTIKQLAVRVSIECSQDGDRITTYSNKHTQGKQTAPPDASRLLLV